MADEIDRGQASGKVASQGRQSNVRSPDISNLDDLGATRQRVSEWRRVCDAYDEVRDLRRNNVTDQGRCAPPARHFYPSSTARCRRRGFRIVCIIRCAALPSESDNPHPASR